MPLFVVQLPSGETLTDDFARELVSLLGVQAPDSSNHADDARTHGAVLASSYARLDDAARESFVPLASELLPEWETRLGVLASTGSSDAQRQAALTGVRRAGGSNNRTAFLAALQAIDATASYDTGSAVENTTYPRGVFVFSVRVAPAILTSAVQITRITDVIERMKPAHTTYVLSSNEGFFTDDPNSLTDTVGDVLAE